MTTTQQDTAERICREIRDQADREARAIRFRAEEERRVLLEGARAEGEHERSRILAAAREQAERRRSNAMALWPVEIARMRAARTESLLDAVRREVIHQLDRRDSPEYQESLLELTLAACRGLSGRQFIVEISDCDLRDHGVWLAASLQEKGLLVEVRARPDVLSGARVTDPEGRQVWDNRLSARLTRLWPQLRAPLIDMLHLDGGMRP